MTWCNTRPCPSSWPPPPTQDRNSCARVRVTWYPNSHVCSVPPEARTRPGLFVRERSVRPRSWLRQLSWAWNKSARRGGALRRDGRVTFDEWREAGEALCPSSGNAPRKSTNLRSRWKERILRQRLAEFSLVSDRCPAQLRFREPRWRWNPLQNRLRCHPEGAWIPAVRRRKGPWQA